MRLGYGWSAGPFELLDRLGPGRLAERLRAAGGPIPPLLVELGSGSSVKTRHLLRAWTAGGRRAEYFPVDISREMLQQSCAALAREHRGLEVRGVAASYERAFPLFRDLSPLVLVFLGSTIGNFNPQEMSGFLDRISANLSPGDHLLLGIDLVKDIRTLEAAYNDLGGWSAAFTALTRTSAAEIARRMRRGFGSLGPWSASRTIVSISRSTSK